MRIRGNSSSDLETRARIEGSKQWMWTRRRWCRRPITIQPCRTTARRRLRPQLKGTTASAAASGGGGGGGSTGAADSSGRAAACPDVLGGQCNLREERGRPRAKVWPYVDCGGRRGRGGHAWVHWPRLILFGGATALEGNSAASGTPSSAGSAGIRLAGATADVHCYDVLTNKWSRITPFGEPPTPRAAHVATAVGTMVVIQGGIGPAGLSAEDLHVLDLTQQRPRWHRVVVQGPGPGPRYGHVMALVGQRYLMAIGGNDGKRPLADVWALDTAAKPYEWRKLEPEGEGPPPCIGLVL
ncbi:hypothetical protein Prudu_016702 [Prunus dulcis]|uniref:Galactose oxidase/kelch repeat superfamily protein n=1 Tax=Prunus dulcis TaxID=3755 RepID=A0A4Y1RM10_PRUDU|nr:hypothetical protein Prudu_016702 [Prunus dulcis]